MSDHLPECLPFYRNIEALGGCVCPALRACEARVFRQSVAACRIAYLKGLETAEEAVRAALSGDERNLHAELTTLAAIDALRN